MCNSWVNYICPFFFLFLCVLQQRKARRDGSRRRVPNGLGNVHVESQRCDLHSSGCARCKGSGKEEALSSLGRRGGRRSDIRSRVSLLMMNMMYMQSADHRAFVALSLNSLDNLITLCQLIRALKSQSFDVAVGKLFVSKISRWKRPRVMSKGLCQCGETVYHRPSMWCRRIAPSIYQLAAFNASTIPRSWFMESFWFASLSLASDFIKHS